MENQDQKRRRLGRGKGKIMERQRIMVDSKWKNQVQERDWKVDEQEKEEKIALAEKENKTGKDANH